MIPTFLQILSSFFSKGIHSKGLTAHKGKRGGLCPSPFLWLGAVFFFILSLVLPQGFSNGSTSKRLLPPAMGLKNYVLGYNDALASLLWVRVLQDIEKCDQNNGDREGTVQGAPPSLFKTGLSDLDQILMGPKPRALCDRGWVYQMLDSITDLSPDFYRAYLTGGSFLSVLVDDRKGAQLLYKKGLDYFPEDWRLLYQSAYHELFEMRNPHRAAELLKQSGDRGAPPLVYALAAQVFTKKGKALIAQGLLQSVLARKPQAPGMEVVRSRLMKIQNFLAHKGGKKTGPSSPRAKSQIPQVQSQKSPRWPSQSH